jgi:hypothetical protein
MNNKQIIEDAFLSQGINPTELQAVIPHIDFQFTFGIPSPVKFPAFVDKISVAVSINEGEAFVSMRATEFLWILKETRRIKTVFCPSCKSSNISKNGFDIKQNQMYLCNNDECIRVGFTFHANPRY